MIYCQELKTSKDIVELPTSEGYDQWSEIYDTNKNPLCALDEIAWKDNFSIALSGKKVLDLGCGTGRVTQILEREGAAVVGIDGSEGMLKIAKQKCSSTT